MSVAIPHAAAVGMEGRYGLLKRAAARIGLRAKGFRAPRRARKRQKSDHPPTTMLCMRESLKIRFLFVTAIP